MTGLLQDREEKREVTVFIERCGERQVESRTTRVGDLGENWA
jgi:hypothetical protein